MAVYTAPTTRSTGALISASIWNTDVVENLKYLKDSPVFDGDISVGDDLFLTSTGAVINFASGDVTITHSTNTLTFAGAASGYVFADGPLKTPTTVSVGNATPANTGAGITFPASQSASSDANTLDDYEEGSWTPTISGSTSAGTGTYTTQIGRYTKIGNRVWLDCLVSWTAHTGTGSLTLTGLPFTSVNVSGYNAVAPAYVSNIALTANNVIQAYIAGNSQTVGFDQYPTGGGASPAVPMDGAGAIIISVSYQVG